MKKFFCVSLIKTIAACIADLMTLKQKLTAVNADAPGLSDLNPGEYFIGNEKCAAHLGVSPTTISRYASAGLLKSFHAGQYACFKKIDVDNAIENVPFLKERFEAQLSGKRIRRVPQMSTICEVSDDCLFIKLTYQGWHCLVCTSAKNEGNQSAINKLCKKVIRAYHKIKPFSIEPDEKVRR